MLAPGYKGSPRGAKQHLWGNRALRVSSAFAPFEFELPFRPAVSSSLIQRKAVRDREGCRLGRAREWGCGERVVLFFKKPRLASQTWKGRVL